MKNANIPDIKLTTRFKKQRKAAPLEIKEAFRETIALFLEDQKHPFLRNHELREKFAGFRSVDVTEDWRALFKVKQTRTYINQEKEHGNTLWNGAKLDFYQPHPNRDEVMVLRSDNVIQRPDGKFVLVDFIYMDPDYANQFRTQEELRRKREKLLKWNPV